jgi:hypothetical protein
MSTININISKVDLSLDQVDNTSDLNKPISTDTQTALDTKVDKVVGSRLITSDESALLGNTSGTNTGDQDLSGLVPYTGATTDLVMPLSTNIRLLNTLNVNAVAYVDNSNNLQTLSLVTYPNLTELSRVKGLTSAVQTQLDTKQNTLVSGTNIKTINGNSLVGLGDVVVGANVPQANKIYVDSVNGVDSTGRGNINTPYLTPEYALADITNTGTVTATTTNNSETLTAVSDTTDIKIGQKISGTGIPWDSIVQSKTVDTIVLSQKCTASATITIKWLTIYELRLNGNFIATSNWFKEGFYFARNESVSVSWGAFSLYEITTLQTFDYFNDGGFNYNGLTTTSDIFKNSAVQQDVLFNCTINGTSVTSITTGILFFSGGGVYQQRGNYTFNFQKAIAKFGYVLTTPYYFAGANLNVRIPYSYGLLGGVNSPAGSFFTGNWYGTIECPASVQAIQGSYINYSDGRILGSVTIQGSGEKSLLSVSSITGTSCSLNNVIARCNISQAVTCLSNVDFYGSTSNSFNVTGTNNRFYGSANFGINVSGSGKIEICKDIVGLYQLTLAGTSIVDINSRVSVANTFSVASGCTLNINAPTTATGGLSNSGTINQNEILTITSGSLTMNSGCVVNIYKTLKGSTATNTIPNIIKIGGRLNLYPGSRLEVSNGKSPIQCTLNTSDSKDIYMFNTISNGDNATYGLFFAFDGSSYVPNDLVGGVLYENTTF